MRGHDARPTGRSPGWREETLERETHRHDLLEPATLRWVARLLSDLGDLPASDVAGHLEAIAELAGGALDVRAFAGRTRTEAGAGRGDVSTPSRLAS